MPADAAMACAIIAGLPGGTGLTTSELGLRQVRPVRAAGTGVTVMARGRMLEAGPPVALAEVTVTDEAGRLITHGGSLCVMVPALAAPGEPDGEPAAGEIAGDGPDPWERPLNTGSAVAGAT